MHDIGWRELTRYYRQAIDIAKTITGQGNESEAVSEFRSRLKSHSLYLNKQPFPKNESDEDAFQKCIKSKCCRVIILILILIIFLILILIVILKIGKLKRRIQRNSKYVLYVMLLKQTIHYVGL